jgi:hypothetical protein
MTTRVVRIVSPLNQSGEKIMTKGQNNKKVTKKKPLKTLKEKKQAKREKKTNVIEVFTK